MILHVCTVLLLAAGSTLLTEGDPIKPTSKPPVDTPKPTPHPNKASAGGVSEEEQQFLTWLSEQKDEVPDVDTDEFETGHRKHANTAEYCKKYKVNYGSYCVNSNIEKLEGVLPQFCSIYSHHCEGDAGEFPKPKPLLEEKMEKSDAKAPPPPSEAPVGEGVDDSFNGPVAKYCQKFSAQYQQFCESEQRAAFGKADEFCMSYRDSCKPPSSSKAPAPMSDSAGSRVGVSDAAKEIEDIDLPESGEDTGTEAPSSETEEKPSTKSSKVHDYCEQYWENFNFYCAGESSAEHEKFCRSYRNNCPQKVGSLKESGSFLGGKEKGEERDSGGGRAAGAGEAEAGAGDTLFLYKGDRKEYCDKFAVNYEYYCRGDSDNPEITAKFCPSYKNGCRDRLEGPPNPFTKGASRSSAGTTPGQTVDANFPDFDRPGKKSRRRGKGRNKVERKKRACTPDCDQRVFPHCTQSCKCDFSYPYVQKFCNPPPLPLFLNPCRLWYAGCPKYERYHYASQFIYSKAEKGKKVELPLNSKPFSVLSPNGERIPVVVRQPGVNTIAKDQPLRDTVDWDHPVVLTQDDIENAQKKQESTYDDELLRRDTVRWDSPVVLNAEDIEEAQRLKSAAKENPLRDTVRWDSPLVLKAEDFELVTPKPLKNAAVTSLSTANSELTRAKDRPLKQRDDPGEEKPQGAVRARDRPLRDTVDWGHPVVLTQDDIEIAQKKHERAYGDEPARRDTVPWDSPVVLNAGDIEEAQRLKSAAKDNPLRDTVRWDSPLVLEAEDFELVTPKPLKNAAVTRLSTASSELTRAKDRSLKQRDDPGEEKPQGAVRARDQPLRDTVNWDHPVVLTQGDIENAQKKHEPAHGDEPARRDTVRWDSPLVLSAKDIEEAQKVKSAAKYNPLRDIVRWDSPLVLKAEDFELVTPKPLKSAAVTSSSTASSELARAKGSPLKQRDDPGEEKPIGVGRAKDTPIVPSDSVFSNAISQYGAFTDSGGVLHRPRSRSPFTKPGLWEANPDNPHNRDHANKYWYRPESVSVDWLSGQIAWGAHYAVPAAGVGGTDGFSTVHFPTIGTFLNIPDDYD